MARVRTKEKRREIVRIANELFQAHGYERTSMSMISEKVGGSKATLYGYFPSKEDLLRAALDYDVTTETQRVIEELLSQEDLRQAFTALGIAYLMRRLSSLPVANVRSMANLPADSTIGKDFYDSVIRPAWERLAGSLKKLMDEGRLRDADPFVAAMHWKGLNEWDLFEKRLLGAMPDPDPKELAVVAAAAADAFLRIYGPEEAAKPKKAASRKASPR